MTKPISSQDLARIGQRLHGIETAIGELHDVLAALNKNLVHLVKNVVPEPVEQSTPLGFSNTPLDELDGLTPAGYQMVYGVNATREKLGMPPSTIPQRQNIACVCPREMGVGPRGPMHLLVCSVLRGEHYANDACIRAGHIGHSD